MTSLADTKHIFIRADKDLSALVFIERFMAHRLICIWLRPRAVHVMHARFARDEIINSLREKKLLKMTVKNCVRENYETA